MKKESPNVFTTDDKITPLEIDFIRAVEAARDFTPSADDVDKGRIQGELIRAILIGAPLKHHPDADAESGARAVRITPHGIRIVPAAPKEGKSRRGKPAGAGAPMLRIAGELNLAGIGAAGGGYLPPLRFDRCMFEQPIKLSGAQLESLTLADSRFSALLAVDARINGKVTIDGCRPRNDPVDPSERHFATHELAAFRDGSHRYVRSPPRAVAGSGRECGCPHCATPGTGRADNCSLCCVINLRSAAIDGSLEILDCYLRAPKIVGRVYSRPRLWDNWAASFNGLQVRDRVNIERTTFVGRLSFISAEIGDDVWICGGKVFASAECRSIDFQLATIGGLLAFQAAEPTAGEEATAIRAFPAVVLGQISAIGLNAAEVWIGEGFYFAHDTQKRGAFPTINFSKADTKGSFKIGAYHDYHIPDPERLTAGAKIHGEVCLQAMTIGKNLNVHGADPEGIAEALDLDNVFFRSLGVARDEAPYLKLSGHGLKVDRRVYISHGCFRDTAKCTGTGPTAGPAQPGVKDRQPAAIDLWKSTIGIGFRIGEQCTCSGALRINSCVIGREVVIGCRLIEAGPAECAAEGKDKKAIPYLVDISESTIKGHLKIGRHVPRANAAAQAPDESETVVTINGGFNLESAHIQGSILFGHVAFDLRAFELHDTTSQCLGSGRGSATEEKRIALNLRDCTCGSDLDVHSLRWRLPSLAPRELCAVNDLPRGLDRMRPARQARRFQSIAASSFALIDLRGLQCGLLIDGFGAEWGLIYRLRLRLAGIKIGEVEPASHKAPHASPGRPERARLRWLAHQNCRQPVTKETVTATEPAEPVPVGLLERYFCAREEDFVPQAYDVFSTAYRRAGENRAAEHILIEKKNLENALRFQRLARRWKETAWRWPALLAEIPLIAFLGLSWWLGLLPRPFDSIGIGAFFLSLALLLWPAVIGWLQILFRFGFRYGLSVQSATLVFGFFVLLGTSGVYWARNGGLAPVSDWNSKIVNGELDKQVALVLDVEYQPHEVAQPSDNTLGAGQSPPAPRRSNPRDAGTRIATEAVYARPTPCNLDVNSLLYALDMFLPLIDLDQERRCTVRDAPPDSAVDDYAWWRILKALYELAGWLVTSLLVLTVTGVLRRDLER